MLTIEKYMLLRINEKNGKLRSNPFTQYGFAGSMLLDLAVKGKIDIGIKKVKIKDSTPIGDEIIDAQLERIKSSKKEKTLGRWIEKLTKNYRSNKAKIFKKLANEKIIKIETKKTAKLFNIKRYSILKPEIKKKVIEELKKTILNDGDNDENIVNLLSIIKSCNLYKALFPKEFRKQYKKKVNNLVKSNKIGKELKNIITMYWIIFILIITTATSGGATAAIFA